MSISETSDPSLVLEANLPVVDDEQVSLLTSDASEGENMLQDLLELFAAESEPRLELIKAACASQDSESLRRLVHFIAGSAANLGALRLSILCRQVEAALARNDFYGYSELPELLEGEYQEGLRCLKKAAMLG